MQYKLHIYSDAERTARAVAELILEKALTKEKEGKKLNLAVSGGSTPKMLFTLMGEEFEKLIPWNSVRFFWVDERCVEPKNTESNFGMTYDALLQRTFIPGENIYRIKGEDFPSDEAERYQKVLWEVLPAKNNYPVFDLILIGMGEDGHTASIFPYNMNELLNSEFSVEVSKHPESGQKRITLTGGTLCNAEQIVVLVNGSSKADLIKIIVNKENEAKFLPIAHILNSKGTLDFYLDEDAAKGLE